MKNLFVFVMVFTNSQIFGQIHSTVIKLEEAIWENNIGAVCHISMIPQKYQYTDILKVKNSTLLKYVDYSFKIQDSINGKLFPLHIISGIDTDTNIVTIVDKNFNGIFDDDVYILNTEYGVLNENDLATKLPEILIDSYPVINSKRVLEFKQKRIKVSAVPEWGVSIKSRSQLIKTDKLFIGMFSIEYLRREIKIENSDYLISLYSDPLSFDPFKFPIKQYYRENYSLGVYKRSSNSNYKLIAYKNISSNIFTKNFSTVLPSIANNIDLVVSDISLRDSLLKFTLAKNELKNNYKKIQLGEFLLQSIDNGEIQPLFNTTQNERYYFIEFTGSWCAPCKIAKPSLDSLYKDYARKITFITIAVENSFNTAKDFLTKENYIGTKFYINLSEKSTYSIREVLKVNVYPFFIVLDKYGNIIAEASGSDGILEIRKILKIVDPFYFK